MLDLKRLAAVAIIFAPEKGAARENVGGHDKNIKYIWLYSVCPQSITCTTLVVGCGNLLFLVCFENLNNGKDVASCICNFHSNTTIIGKKKK